MKELGIYVLTFNAPKQFSYWCECFIAAYPDVFEKCNKYVINNSDAQELLDQYSTLFSKYNFGIVKEGMNLGICGGRQAAAVHFHNSKEEYMIFYEDDMVMRSQGNYCKSGFIVYQPNLFENILDIIKKENLSFLKLCYSEVYGTNHENWAMGAFNIEEQKQLSEVEEYKPYLKKTVKIDYIGCHNSISYAVGSFFYCNWPIIFSKKGNQAVFINIQIANKQEFIWTRIAYIFNMVGRIRTGCLLASPILHHRKFCYNEQDRIENETGYKMNGAKICLESN